MSAGLKASRSRLSRRLLGELVRAIFIRCVPGYNIRSY